MEISIIIVSFNTKKLTLGCLRSIAKAKPKIKYEIIVIDNNSSDKSVEAIQKLKSKMRNMQLIENKENLGFARANNIGIRKAKGKYILLLNSDTEVKKGMIEEMHRFAKSHGKVGVVGAKLLNEDGSIQESVFRMPTLKRTIRQYWFGEKGILDKYVPNDRRGVEVEAVVMAAFMITPAALAKVGKLDERYFMYFEDLEYCRQVRRAGLKVYYLPNAEVIHYHGKSGGKMESLVKSSKIFHGSLKYYLIWLVMWTGQKFGGITSVE